MKSAFVVIALMVCVSLVFGQANVATVTQNGSNTTASVTQSGTGSNNAIVNQASLSGNQTKSTVVQTGYANIADVGQVHRSSPGAVGGMETKIEQIGDQNSAKQRQDQPYQGYDYETIIQHGNRNVAEQYQTYYNNTAYIKQYDGNDNKAYQYQNNNNPHEAVSSIQRGNRNFSTQSQAGLNEGATVVQTGDDNFASQQQSGGTWNPPGGPKASILQIGSSNTATQTQSTGAYAPKAALEQHGNNNFGLQTQAGGFNEATIKTWGSGNGVLGDEIRTTQNGYSNHATVEQGLAGDVNYSRASITQLGDDNHGAIKQEGGDYNEARISSTGNGNGTLATPVKVDQNGAHNVGTITANGNLNAASVTQQSSYNTANLLQNGNANSATVLQKTGNTNVVNLTQSGGALANILQDGTNNTVMGLNLDPMATSLNGSMIDVDQIGTNNVLHLQQTNGASATVLQTGVANTAVVIQN